MEKLQDKIILVYTTANVKELSYVVKAHENYSEKKVTYKKRYETKQRPLIFRENKVGRTYEDYCAFIEKHPDASIVEMDTVEGIKGGKALLTLHFVNFNWLI